MESKKHESKKEEKEEGSKMLRRALFTKMRKKR